MVARKVSTTPDAASVPARDETHAAAPQQPSSPRAGPAKFDRAMVEAKMRSDGWVTTEKSRAKSCSSDLARHTAEAGAVSTRRGVSVTCPLCRRRAKLEISN